MTDTRVATKSRPWWTLYFCFMVLVWLWACVFGDHSPIDLANDLLAGWALVGPWGYIREIRIGWRAFWIGFMVLSIAQIGYGFATLLSDATLRNWTGLWLLVGLAAMVIAPQWIALWRYAFSSPGIWSASPRTGVGV